MLGRQNFWPSWKLLAPKRLHRPTLNVRFCLIATKLLQCRDCPLSAKSGPERRRIKAPNLTLPIKEASAFDRGF
jgi:hypothetical protein